MSTPDEWRQEGWEEEIQEERDRYKRERDELLAVLFQPLETRSHLAKILIDGEQPSLTPAQSKAVSSTPRPMKERPGPRSS